MSVLSEIVNNYNKESLNQDPMFEHLDHADVTVLVLPHVPGSDIYVVSTSWSEMSGITSSNILQTLNLKEINTFEYDPGENYTIKTHMFTKIDKSKKAGVLVSGINAETEEYFTLFEG